MFLASDFSADKKISFDEYMVGMGRSPPGDYRYDVHGGHEPKAAALPVTIQLHGGHVPQLSR